MTTAVVCFTHRAFLLHKAHRSAVHVAYAGQTAIFVFVFRYHKHAQLVAKQLCKILRTSRSFLASNCCH